VEVTGFITAVVIGLIIGIAVAASHDPKALAMAKSIEPVGVLWVNAIANRMPTASSKDVSRIFNKLKSFAEPIREVEPNIFVLNPLAIPAYGVPWMRTVNKYRSMPMPQTADPIATTPAAVRAARVARAPGDATICSARSCSRRRSARCGSPWNRRADWWPSPYPRP